MTDIDWKRMPSLSALRAFEATARMDGFSRAARALNVTPAAVAQQVRGLEADLGVKLVQKAGRGLALTEEGRRLTQALSQGFGVISEGVIRTRARQADRPVRVSTTAGFGQWVLMPVLQDFWARHPDIRVSLDVGPSRADVASGAFDLAIRAGRPKERWPGTRTEPLINSRYVMIAGPEIAAQAESGTPLSDLPWVLDPPNSDDEAWLFGLDLSRDGLRVTEVASAALAIGSVLKGYGITFSVERIVRDFLTAGQLKRLPAEGLPEVSYHLVYGEGPVRAPVATFMDWLRANMQED
ncbi:LysR family transcriptional regulator [Pseudooceanicola sp. C21-150M6]|uniref:LysR family transcriptional regulator n=1 Tax=Pseudooceanicola sp. C21-150M6 TaxID=3434355 RepID=UPI003D7FB048